MTVSAMKSEDVGESAFTIPAIAQLTGCKVLDVSTLLDESKASPARATKTKTFYRLSDVFPVLLKAGRKRSTVDYRNEAQAIKVEIESEILLENYLPIDEAVELVAKTFGIINVAIEDAEIADETKGNLINTLRGLSVADLVAA